MPTEENQWVIDVKGLTKIFDGNKAVDDLYLKVKKGEIFGFLGPNGSGKTTTIRMICGLMKPDAGSGTCLGFDIIKQADQIKRRIGYMTQKFSLYEDLSAYENLDFVGRMYGIKNRHERICQAFDEFEFPKEEREKLAGELSGGWKQRLALTATTLSDPELLLLDEPTAGVDPKARRDFWEHINRLATQGITSLVATHYMDEAERCYRLAYLSYGKLLLEGTREEVIEKSHLVTYEVKGPNLPELHEELHKIPAVDQVVPFGQELHVSGHNKEELDSQIAKLKTKEQEWRAITPSLEDVFISSIQKKEEKTT